MTVIHYSVRGRALVGRGKGRARPVWPDPTDGQRAVVRTARLKPDGRVPQGERILYFSRKTLPPHAPYRCLPHRAQPEKGFRTLRQPPTLAPAENAVVTVYMKIGGGRGTPRFGTGRRPKRLRAYLG